MSAPNIYQVSSEVDELLEVLKQNPPSRVLEIGIGDGGTLQEWANVATDDALLIAIDLTTSVKINRKCNQRIHFLKSNSLWIDTADEVKAILNGEQLDFLFIDGDHNGVQSDFILYSPFVKDGGLIALHDIVPGPKDNVGAVPEFWKVIKKEWPNTQEFVHDWNQGGYGIGLIQV